MRLHHPRPRAALKRQPADPEDARARVPSGRTGRSSRTRTRRRQTAVRAPFTCCCGSRRTSSRVGACALQSMLPLTPKDRSAKMMSSTADRCTARVGSPHDFSAPSSCGCVACAVQVHARHPERPRRSARGRQPRWTPKVLCPHRHGGGRCGPGPGGLPPAPGQKVSRAADPRAPGVFSLEKTP